MRWLRPDTDPISCALCSSLLAAVLATILVGCGAPHESYRIEKTATGREGMVVSAHPLATSVGVEVLKRGGNAIDAAVAVHFALAVTYPTAGNLGGGGFMIYRSADGTTATLDFREKAPQAASRDMYLDAQGAAIAQMSRAGHLAAGVPGSVAGVEAAHQRFGSLPFQQLVEPAVKLARDGFRITSRTANRLNKYSKDILAQNDQSTAFTRNDRPWQESDVLRQRDLARTLRRIAIMGSQDFYRGETAELIVQAMREGGGLITAEDLESYAPRWRDPLAFQYKKYQLISMPPPSSGGVALGQLLAMVEPYPLADWGIRDVRTIHLMVEAERRVYADRAQYMGDPDFYEVPVGMLMDSSYLVERMANLSMDTAISSMSVGAEGYLVLPESPQTTHFTIVDAAGNAVSFTTTLNSSYGCKVVVDGAGFFLNNEMDDFSVKPGVPNIYGLVGNEANAIAPGKRMLSSMTPTIVTRDNELLMTLGTPGGARIITSVFQVFLSIAEFGMSPEEAVTLGRFHHQWLPDEIVMERDALPETTLDTLREMGHRVKVVPPYSAVEVILRSSDGTLHGAADPRGDDHAMKANQPEGK